MGRFARAGDKVCFWDFLQLLAIDLKCCTVKRKCSKDLFSPPSSPLCPSLVPRFTVVPQGCVWPLKRCHTAVLLPRGPGIQPALQRTKARCEGRCKVSAAGAFWGVKYEIMLWSQPSCERQPRRDLSECPTRAVQQLSSFSFPYRDVAVSRLIKLKTLSTQAALSSLLDLSISSVP